MEIAMLICGIILGFAIAYLVVSKLLIGELCLVQTHLQHDPQPVLDLDKPFDAFRKKKYVLLKIVNIDTRK